MMWLPIHSAICACLLDGLGLRDTAAAIGRCPALISMRTREIKATYGVRTRTQLLVQLILETR